MSTTNIDLRRDAIRISLTQRAGRTHDANAIAEATVSTLHHVAAQLAPVIGERGVDVLFSRALHQVGATVPWLATAGDNGESAPRIANLKLRFAGQEAATAAEAGSALLLNFTLLLATLIGESLTERLLDPVWTSPSPTSEQETAL